MTEILGVDVCRMDDVLCVFLTGELDIGSAQKVSMAMDIATTEGMSAVLMDLTGLRYIDSAGLTELLRLHRAANARDVAFSVHVHKDTVVHKVIHLTGADEVLSVVVEPGATAGRVGASRRDSR